MLDRVVVDGDGEAGGTLGAGGRLAAGDAALPDEAAAGRQRDDDGDRIGLRRRIVTLDDRVGGRDGTADAGPPLGVAAGAKPDGRTQLEAP